MLIAMNNITYQACIEACLACVAACRHCASACLREEEVQHMKDCIQLDMECAALCDATAAILSISGRQAKEMAALCAGICDQCGAECERHQHDHCKACAEACRICAEKCRAVTAAETRTSIAIR
jgi:hypothetical protein